MQVWCFDIWTAYLLVFVRFLMQNCHDLCTVRGICTRSLAPLLLLSVLLREDESARVGIL